MRGEEPPTRLDELEARMEWTLRLYLCEADLNLTNLVTQFSEAMRTKLGLKHAEGRRGWAIEDDDEWTPETIREHMLSHVGKGDPIDVANFAMFLWYHERRIKDEAENRSRE